MKLQLALVFVAVLVVETQAKGRAPHQVLTEYMKTPTIGQKQNPNGNGKHMGPLTEKDDTELEECEEDVIHLQAQMADLQTRMEATTGYFEQQDEKMEGLLQSYEDRTVRQCQSGSVDFCATTSCCNKPNWPCSGITTQVKFDPPFHKVPKVTYSITTFQSSTSKVNYNLRHENLDADSMRLYISLHQTDLSVTGLVAHWLACA